MYLLQNANSEDIITKSFTIAPATAPLPPAALTDADSGVVKAMASLNVEEEDDVTVEMPPPMEQLSHTLPPTQQAWTEVSECASYSAHARRHEAAFNL